MSCTKNNPPNLFNIKKCLKHIRKYTEKNVLEIKSDGDNWPFCPEKVIILRISTHPL